jgi:type IV secretion system protein VirD4
MERRPPAAPNPLSPAQDLVLFLGIVAVLVSLTALDWIAGVDTWLSHGRWAPPSPNPFVGGWELVSHAGNPADAWPVATRSLAPAGALYWLTVAVLGLAICVLAGGLVVLVGRHRGGDAGHKGLASRGHLREHLSARAVVGRAPALRPSVARPTVGQLGIALGRSVDHGAALFGTVEDSYAILGPPGMGKTSTMMVHGVIEYPGPAIVTSTKPELLTLTAPLRPGPVWVFDPAGSVPPAPMRRMGWRAVRWDPVRGCELPRIAMRRARVAVGASAAGKGVTSGDYWRDSAIALCQGYLHAAALAGADLHTVMGWVDNPSDRGAVDVLLDDRHAAPGWGERLMAQLDGGQEDRERRSVFNSLRRAFDCVADPEVMAVCCPGEAPVFDPDAFLAQGGTLYLVGDPEDQVQVAPLLTLLLDGVVGAARRRAARLAGGRLDPPLGVWLDEATQIAPLPSLPSLVSDGRGVGITVVVVLQTLARARQVWEEEGAATLWQNCTAKLIFGGISDADELESLSRLCGDYDQTVVSRSRDWNGRPSETRSIQRRRRMAPDEIRELGLKRPGTALLLYRQLPPTTVRLVPYFQGRHATRIADATARIGVGG